MKKHVIGAMALDFYSQTKNVHVWRVFAPARTAVENKPLEFIIDMQIEKIEAELNKKFGFITGYRFRVIKEKVEE